MNVNVKNTAGLGLSIPYGLDKRNNQFIVCFMITRAVLLIKYSLGTERGGRVPKASVADMWRSGNECEHWIQASPLPSPA